jgi:glycosyltransferase involved in cell wall biosynthesis
MACGCAVAAVDNGGHREFAQHESTALLSPPKDAAALAGNILRLVQDPDLRMRIAQAGNAYIRNFTWDKSVNLFEKAILGWDADYAEHAERRG